MKKFSLILFFVLISCCVFSGCTSGSVSLFITSYPKIVYEVGEEVDFSGLKLECLNTDGTTTRVFLGKDDFSEVDTSTPGEKVVKITKGEISTTFKIYVAHALVTEKSTLKQTINNAQNCDVIYIKQGEYIPTDTQDESLYNILIDKKLTLVGDGKDKTIIHGNLLVGATESQSAFLPLENFEGVNILNIGFKLDSKVNNRFLTYEGPYGNYDLFGAIKTYNSSKVNIKNCSFEGFSYGVNADNGSNLSIINNSFKDIKICGIQVNQNIQNSTITKNSFIDIAVSSLVYDNGKQGNSGAMYLSFNKAENAGVIIANNNFARVGQIMGSLVYVNPGANELELNGETNFHNGFYVNNSAIIFLVSSTENNLDVSGIILSSNNYGKTLENISFGTNSNNLINQNGVVII